jgi:hypothetical protein
MKFKLVCYDFFSNGNFKDGVDMLSLEGKPLPFYIYIKVRTK